MLTDKEDARLREQIAKDSDAFEPSDDPQLSTLFGVLDALSVSPKKAA